MSEAASPVRSHSSTNADQAPINTSRGRVKRVVRPRLTWPLAGWLLLCAVIILAVSVFVGFGLKQLSTAGALPGDLAVERWLVDQRTGTIDGMTKVGSSLADTMTAIVVATVAFFVLRIWLGRFYESCVLVVSLGGELLIFLAVAALVQRPRPPVERLDAAPPTSSFPSGHTAASVALFGFLAVMLWRYADRRLGAVLALAFAVIPLVVAASRMYRGMHYPSDVVAGALVGGVWLFCVLRVLLPPPAEIRSVA